jgi:type IV pilus assembly protein PilE
MSTTPYIPCSPLAPLLDQTALKAEQPIGWRNAHRGSPLDEHGGAFVQRLRVVKIWYGCTGMTLVELLAAVAIISILAAIAVPGWGAIVLRTRLTEATTGLTDMQLRLAQYHRNNRHYPDSCIAATGTLPAEGSIRVPATTSFSIRCEFPTDTTYRITATGRASDGTAGFVYAIDQTSLHRTVSLPVGWTGTGSPCWVIKPSGVC